MRLLLLFVLSTLACEKTKKQDTEPEDVSPIIAGHNLTVKPRIEFEQQKNIILVKPTNLPEDVKDVTCTISQVESDCKSGITLNSLTDGLYTITLSVTTKSNPNPQNTDTQFRISNGVLTEHIDENSNLIPITITQKDDSPFKNYQNVSRDSGFQVPVEVQMSHPCDFHLYCSRNNDIWARCGYKNNTIQVTPEENLEGFQTLLVKARCLESDDTSNILSFHWYGTSPGYTHLTLTRRNVHNLNHYRLNKETDCLGELQFQCKEESETAYQSCPNLKTNPQKGFSIRAICKKGEDIKIGPAFTE